MRFIINKVPIKYTKKNTTQKIFGQKQKLFWRFLNIRKLFCRFYSSSEPEIEEIFHGFPALASHRSAQFFWSFSHFRSSFIEIEVLNEEKYSILRIFDCCSLQQQIFLAFYNDFEPH